MATISSKPASNTASTSSRGGVAIIPSPSELTRLNYFDGKFLKADDLQLEQSGHRQLVSLSNVAGGSGIVHGFDLQMSPCGAQLDLGAGLAIDPHGQVLHLPLAASIGIADLLQQSRSVDAANDGSPNSMFADCETHAAEPATPVVDSTDFYLITISHAEAYCGEEDVVGNLCQPACVDSMQRPLIREGVLVRAAPLLLCTPLAASSSVSLNRWHLRSQVASAYFRGEDAGDSLSATGLQSEIWCRGATSFSGSEVPIGVLARIGSTTLFLDAWTVRRERMETPPQRYWAGHLALRPWSRFLAQLLQFQCQLRSCLADQLPPGEDDPCHDAHKVIGQASETMQSAVKYYAEVSQRLATSGALPADEFDRFQAQVDGLSQLQSKLLDTKSRFSGPPHRMLIRCGIIELPSAGYLPVVPLSNVSVNAQVRRLLGEGVDLRFCAVRPDFIPHALEEAQHMERISLLQGLDDNAAKPEVDVLVPHGEILTGTSVARGRFYNLDVRLHAGGVALTQLIISGNNKRESSNDVRSFLTAQGSESVFSGVARGEQSAAGSTSLNAAAVQVEQPKTGFDRTDVPASSRVPFLKHAAVATQLTCDQDPFEMRRLEVTRVHAEVSQLLFGNVVRFRFGGNLQLRHQLRQSTTHSRLQCKLTGTLLSDVHGPNAANVSSRTIAVDEDVILERQLGPSGQPLYRLTIPQPDILGAARRQADLQFTRSWSDADTWLASASLLTRNQPKTTAVRPAPTETPLFEVRASRDAAAGRPGHPAHQRGITALRAIGSAMADPHFEELAVRGLFPPAEQSAAEVVIRAREDWVMFHRRRRKQCAHDAAPLPGLAQRTYRLYVIALDDAQQREALMQALQDSDSTAIDAFRPAVVDLVRYSAGIHTLDTPADELRRQWQAIAPSNSQVLYSAIASQGVALDEGPALAGARLSSAVSAISPVAPAVDDAQQEVLPRIPVSGSVTAEPHDGVIVIGVTALATECHRVFRASREQADNIAELDNSVSPKLLPQLIQELGGQELGTAHFKEGSDQMVSDVGEIVDAWNQAGNGPLMRILTFTPRPDQPPTAEQVQQIELAGTRSSGIGEPLAAVAAEILHPEEPGELPGCPTITVLVAAVPTSQTIQHQVFGTITPLTFEALHKEIRTTGLRIDALRNPLGQVELEADTQKPDPETLADVVRNWKDDFPSGQNSPVQVLAVSRRDISAPDQHELHRQRSQLIQQEITSLPVEHLRNANDNFPPDARSITLIVVQRRID